MWGSWSVPGRWSTRPIPARSSASSRTSGGLPPWAPLVPASDPETKGARCAVAPRPARHPDPQPAQPWRQPVRPLPPRPLGHPGPRRPSPAGPGHHDRLPSGAAGGRGAAARGGGPGGAWPLAHRPPPPRRAAGGDPATISGRPRQRGGVLAQPARPAAPTPPASGPPPHRVRAALEPRVPLYRNLGAGHVLAPADFAVGPLGLPGFVHSYSPARALSSSRVAR